jgi:hypothetical protein
MLFGKRNRRPTAPVARRVVTPADNARGLVSLSNGPETPIMGVDAMRRALTHAAWRDPSVERRKNDEVRAAIRTLERTAACVDLAQERIAESIETLTMGQKASEQVMRGLLTARLEELLDSLERVAILALDGHVNLLSGAAEHQSGLSLDIGTAGFSYVLSPINIHRGRLGLDIRVLESGFDDDNETFEVETALLKAQKRLAQFGERLSHDAIMLVKIAQANDAETEALNASAHQLHLLAANEVAVKQTKSEDAA